MDQYTVELTQAADPAFIRANRDLIIRYRSRLAQCSDTGARTDLLKQLWLDEYGCRVEGSFERLVFESDRRLSFYLLKWK